MRLFIGIRFSIFNGWISRKKLYNKNRLILRLAYLKSFCSQYQNYFDASFNVWNKPLILISYSDCLPIWCKEELLALEETLPSLRLLPVTELYSRYKLSHAFDIFLRKNLISAEEYCFVRVDDDDLLLPEYFSALESFSLINRLKPICFSGTVIAEYNSENRNLVTISHAIMSAAGLALFNEFHYSSILLTPYDTSWIANRKLLPDLHGHPHSDLDCQVILDGKFISAITTKHDFNVSKNDYYNVIARYARKLLRKQSCSSTQTLDFADLKSINLLKIIQTINTDIDSLHLKLDRR